MDASESVYRLKGAGRFSAALEALDAAGLNPTTHVAAAVLRAELLETVGHGEQARAVANRLLQSRRLSVADQSACEYVLASILLDEGDLSGAIRGFQSSLTHARNAKVFERVISPLLKLMVVVAEHSGPGAATSLLAEARQVAIRLGDAHVTAKLHLAVAEMEAKQGLCENARRHLRIVHGLLSRSPNTYLAAYHANLEMALSILLGQFRDAQALGTRAADLA